GGSLGRRLLTKVGDLMHTGDENPVVRLDAPLREAVLVMTRTKMAATSVVDDDGKLVGVFVDGDLRRCLMSGPIDMDIRVGDLLGSRAKFARPDMVQTGPKFATADMMAVEALQILRDYKIIELPVLDQNRKPIGMVHLHDITRAGIT
ncbi:MAG: CBS domain-containing protein, partial [Phycisphaerae bacterium]|nr:CBS domain-containing protein [Phycisphaerae bacterium]